MSSNQTTNYQLHQWEPTDDFLREEFNENFGAIDGAMAGAVVIGRYFGNGKNTQQINLGRRPKAVILSLKVSFSGNANAVYSGMFGEGFPLNGNDDYARVTDDGFSVGNSSSQNYTNQNGYEFRYIAFF